MVTQFARRREQAHAERPHVALAALHLAANSQRVAAYGPLRVFNLIGREIEVTHLTNAVIRQERNWSQT